MSIPQFNILPFVDRSVQYATNMIPFNYRLKYRKNKDDKLYFMNCKTVNCLILKQKKLRGVTIFSYWDASNKEPDYNKGSESTL